MVESSEQSTDYCTNQLSSHQVAPRGLGSLPPTFRCRVSQKKCRSFPERFQNESHVSHGPAPSPKSLPKGRRQGKPPQPRISMPVPHSWSRRVVFGRKSGGYDGSRECDGRGATARRLPKDFEGDPGRDFLLFPNSDKKKSGFISRILVFLVCFLCFPSTRSRSPCRGCGTYRKNRLGKDLPKRLSRYPPESVYALSRSFSGQNEGAADSI